MTPTSPPYLLAFLPAVALLCRRLPARRNPILLLSSLVFYASNFGLRATTTFLFLCIANILFARGIARRRDGGLRMFQAGVLFNLAVFIRLKTTVDPGGSGAFVPFFGLSYLLIHCLGYLTDTYLDPDLPRRSGWDDLLYFLYFPKVLQGPIEPYAAFSARLGGPGAPPSPEESRRGVWLIAVGLLKKNCLADWFGVAASWVFDDPGHFSGWPLAVGAYAYALQIYFDFAGYTDMARGAGFLLGIELTENFDRPYFASSVSDFWRRWHMSFSRWLLAFVFKPLQMRLRHSGAAGTAVALVSTFVVCGFWHGFGANFLAWGAYHGFLMTLSLVPRAFRAGFWRSVSFGRPALAERLAVLATFHAVTFGWILFRSPSLAAASTYLRNLFNPFPAGSFAGAFKGYQLSLLFLAGGAALWLERHADATKLGRLVAERGTFGRWAIYLAMVFTLFFFGRFGGDRFVYFNF